MPTNVKVDDLKINKLTKAQYETAVQGGTIGEYELSVLTDDDTYATSEQLTQGLATKQDTISDLATIRSGAAAGATAVQPGDLATVATTGDYDDLTNKPTIPAAQVNSDWSASSGVAQILNKPTLGTAASANTTDFATAAQGALADTAVQPTAIADMETQTHASATYATKTELATKQDIIQYSTMPTASVDNVDDVVQFVGTTDSTYTNGHFYKCVSDGQDPATYSWEEVSFGGGQTIQVDTMPVAGADNLNKVVQYVGETDSTYMNGCFYRCQRTVAPVETFSGTSRIYNAITVFNREVFAEKILEIFPDWSSTSRFDVTYFSGQGWRIAGTDPLIYVADLSEFGIELSVTPGNYEYFYFSPGAVIYAWISTPKNLVGVYTIPDTVTANIGAVIQYLGESGVKSGTYVRTGGCYKNTKQTQSAVIASSQYITSPAINASSFIAQVKSLTSTQNIVYIGSAEFRYTSYNNRWDITFLENGVRISNISPSNWGLTYSGTPSAGATVKISYNLGINTWVEESEIPTTTGVDWDRALMVNNSGKLIWGYTKTINGQKLVNPNSSSDIEITGLPSTTSATQGQVLTLDANLNAVWETPSGGASAPTLTWYTVSTAGNTLTIADTSSAQLVKVYKNGLLLQPTEDYSISGTTLTTVTAMVVGDKITMEVF